MTTPSPEAVTQPPAVRTEPISTFDQALDQRSRMAVGETSVSNNLLDLGAMALQLSDRLHIGGAGPVPVASDVPSTAVAARTGALGSQASGEDVISRAQQMIDRSFGYAVLTQQLVRGANQVANGLMTLLRSN